MNFPRRSLSAQIAEVQRDIATRRDVYKSLVARRKLKQGEAQERITLMENVLLTLQRIEQHKEIINAAIAENTKDGVPHADIIMPDELMDDTLLMLDDDEEPSCRVCGCTHFDPCKTANGPCFLIEPDLCSACFRGRNEQ